MRIIQALQILFLSLHFVSLYLHQMLDERSFCGSHVQNIFSQYSNNFVNGLKKTSCCHW